MSVTVADGVEVVNFGCRLNIAEGEAVRGAAVKAGARDTIIFNSCAVTDEAVRQARQAVRRALRERPGADVVVTGCAAELEAARFADMGARVVSNNAKGLAQSYDRGTVSLRRRGSISGARNMGPTGDGPLPSQGNSPLVSNHKAQAIPFARSPREASPTWLPPSQSRIVPVM